MAKKIKKRYLFQHHKSVTEGLTFTASTFDSDALLTELLLDSAGPNTSFFVSSRGRIKERGTGGRLLWLDSSDDESASEESSLEEEELVLLLLLLLFLMLLVSAGESPTSLRADLP